MNKIVQVITTNKNNRYIVTQESIDDILASAFEGGINYWCGEAEVVDEYLGEYASEQISRGGKVNLSIIDDDGEIEDVKTLELDAVLEGIKRRICDYEDNGIKRYGISEGSNEEIRFDVDFDSWDADVIVQYAIFGKIVFS